jgi:hypothetical protein
MSFVNLSPDLSHKILRTARREAKDCGRYCHDFYLLRSPQVPDGYFVRYTRTDARNPDEVEQAYRWLCFDAQGEMIDCDPVFASVAKENRFKSGMQTLLYTRFAEEYV